MAEQSPKPPVEIADDESETESVATPSSLNSDGGEKLAASPTPLQTAEAGFRKKPPVHHVLGGGKPADVLLWREKKASAGVLGGATVIWAFFEVLEYHLLPFLCYALMLVLSLLFLWSNAHILIYKSPPHPPDVHVREEPFMQVASTARIEINRAIAILRDIASGRDVKKFIAVVGGLWILSALGNRVNFLTLFFIAVVLLHTVPVVYEKYEGNIDAFAEKVMIESKKKYAIFDDKVVSKIRKGPLRGKKD